MEEAERWLADTVLLAGLSRGGASAAAARSSGAAAPDRMIQKVYRELEVLERQARARVIAGVTARLARTAASLGSAGLELVAPAAPDARRTLVEWMEWESRRAVSERLLQSLRSTEGAATVDRQGGPASLALSLGRLGRCLSDDDAAWLAMVEVALAFGEEVSARDLLLEQLEQLTPAIEGESHEEAALRERCMRLLALAHFLLGEDDRALALTESIPLVLDRSAPMGTLRATLEFRLGRPKARDEFVAPVGPVQRRHVARFLALAHPASSGTGTARELSGGQGLGVSL
jgi:hypothetical protein